MQQKDRGREAKEDLVGESCLQDLGGEGEGQQDDQAEEEDQHKPISCGVFRGFSTVLHIFLSKTSLRESFFHLPSECYREGLPWR